MNDEMPTKKQARVQNEEWNETVQPMKKLIIDVFNMIANPSDDIIKRL